MQCVALVLEWPLAVGETEISVTLEVRPDA
jgi:hypothetical protein